MLPKSINIVCVQSIKSVPTLTINGNCLFDSNFLPGQPLKAEIFDNKIVITPIKKLHSFKVMITK